MSSYLIYSEDEARKQSSNDNDDNDMEQMVIDAEVTPLFRTLEGQLSNMDSIFRCRSDVTHRTSNRNEGMISTTTTTTNTTATSDTSRSEHGQESSPLLTANSFPSIEEATGPLSPSPSTSTSENPFSTSSTAPDRMTADDDLEGSSSYLASEAYSDEYQNLNDDGDDGDDDNDRLSEDHRRYYPNRGRASAKASKDSSGRKIVKLMEGYCILLAVMLLFVFGLMTGRHVWEGASSTNADPSQGSIRSPNDNNHGIHTNKAPRITVGAYYYPWHGGDFHRGDGYVRKLLQQGPSIGEYDDRDPNVISQHLEWSKQGNINLWVTSWWGPHKREDNTTRTVILPHEQLRPGGAFEDHKIALFYETFGRIKQQDHYSLHRIKPDMEFMCEHYLTHPNYYTLEDGRPVLFMYLTRHLDSLVRFESVIRLMRKTVQDACGKDIYIIGDQIFGPFRIKEKDIAKEDKERQQQQQEEDPLNSPDPTAFDLLDGVTNYDVYGSIAKYVGESGGYLTEDAVTEYYLMEQRKWRQYVKEHKGCSYIPSVAPGYNDLGVRPQAEHIPLARSLRQEKKKKKNEKNKNKNDDGEQEDHGSFFRVSLQHARTLVDPDASYLLMVNSFNEWHEDTQIEPAIGKSTSMPYNMTYGMEYHGYGTLYLDLLSNATKGAHIVV